MFRYLFVLSSFLLNIFILGSLLLTLLIFLLFSYYGTNLPSSVEIENYKPATLSRVYDMDGNVSGIFGKKHRIYTPINDIPALVKNAFISAEDKNFYQHLGYDPISLLKAITDALRGKKLRGASTITQQIMKNFLLSKERTGKRKIKELILASRIEKVLTKDQILNVYLNEIYLGQGSYGVTAAAITYFDKKLEELDIGEAAFLAALPKAPSFYHPVRQKERSIQRRNFVIRELNENGFVSDADVIKFVESDLKTVLGEAYQEKELILNKDSSYFTDAIKKSILSKYDMRALERDGLSIRSTLDVSLQNISRTVLQNELIKFDQNLGIYRGPITKLKTNNVGSKELAETALLKLDISSPVNDWFIALVQKVSTSSVEIKILRNDGKFETSELYLDRSWVKKRQLLNNKIIKINKTSQIINVGDIIFVSWDSTGPDGGYWSLRQTPEVQGAFMAMEPNSGKVLAMQGGFSYKLSSFNRAIQAHRQPGSLFKPFVYLAALENGYNPNSIIVDAPISLKQFDGVWRPENASNDWFGVAPLRKGLEYSRNLMTVRLAKDVGMLKVKKYAELFGLYENMPPYLSYSLGAGETSLLKLISAYSILANGGFEVEPSFFDLVQDRYGNTIYKHGHLKCLGCKNIDSSGKRKPLFLNTAKRLVDPISVSQVNSMLQGVVQRGTASRTVGKIGQPIAGKTGTTNKSKDVWFIGFTPSVVVGCYIGYDIPRSLGKLASGGMLCGSAFKEFIESAYGTNLFIDWKIPNGAKVLLVDYDSGKVTNRFNDKAIKEIFRKEQTITDLALNEAIDGGFGMGQDLLFLDNIFSDNIVNKTFLKKSFGDIHNGDRY